MNSYAPGVPESGSQPSSASTQTAPSHADLVRRLQRITNGIDFLLGHPDLKPSDRELALQVLRQTVLFGKETDKITAQQQAHGVRNLNRGTGRHPKTLQRARRRLREAGFMRVFCEPGDRRGNTYSPDFEHMRVELQKLRTPEQIAPGYPGAICSPHQSYPSGSNSQNSARLAGSQPAPPDEHREPRAAPAQPDPPLLPRDSRPCRPAPWKTVPVPDDEVQQMQPHLKGITEAYPRANFGPANRTTARDMLAAAKLADPKAIPDDVAAFLAAKFRDRRPYPYESGLQTFGGMLKVVYEDFGAWFRSHQAPETPVATKAASPSSPYESCEHALPPSLDMWFLHPAPPAPATAPVSPPGPAAPYIAGPCERCSGKGYHLDDTGTESVDGEELKTIAASACTCPKGRKIDYGRLVAIERKEAERRGPGWIAAHRPSDHAANSAA